MVLGNLLSVGDDDKINSGAHGTCSLTKKELHAIYGSPPMYNRIPWSGSSTEGVGNQLGLNYCLLSTMYDKFISPQMLIGVDMLDEKKLEYEQPAKVKNYRDLAEAVYKVGNRKFLMF